MNALESVFLGVPSMLCTWYINTAVEAQACKTFGWQKNKDSTRYIPSELATKFLSLYRNCRLVLLEAAFDQACSEMLERAQRDETTGSNSDSEDREADADDEVDTLVRPIDSTKVVTTTTKRDTLVR